MANSQKKSSALKLLNGNAGKHDNLSSSKVAAKELPLKSPKKLSDGAKVVWREVRKIIEESQSEVYNNLDLVFLARYCEVKAQWQQCLDHMIEHGVSVEIVSTTKSGEYVNIKESSESKMFKNLNPILNQMETQLGLNPQGRKTLGIETGTNEKEDLLSSFLNRKSKKQA